MVDKFLEQLETIIYDVNGTKILREVSDGYTQHLYMMSNGLFLIVYKHKEWIQYRFKLGQLRILDNEQPILFILEDLDYYLKSLFNLNIINEKVSIKSYFNEEKALGIFKDNIQLIFKHYDAIIAENSFVVNINRLEKKLCKCDVKLISNESLEDEMKDLKEKSKGKGLKLEIDSFIQKPTILDEIYEQFGVIEVGIIGLALMCVIYIFIPIFTKISYISDDAFMLLFLLLLVILGGGILIVKKIKNKKNKENSK